MFKISNSQLVEVQVPASSSALSFQIPDQPQLKNKKTIGIEFYSVGDVTIAPSGNAVVSAAFLQKTYLTLYTFNKDGKQGQFIYQIPATSLKRSATGAYVWELPQFDGIYVDYNKSFITVPTTVSGSAFSWIFNVYYAD